MLITDKEQLKEFSTEKRLWQGIPSIDVTSSGRIFVSFYSGEKGETIGNYCMLTYSDDNGKTFSEPIAVVYKKGYRCFDSTLFVDPTGALWFIWSMMPEQAVYACVCTNPDADTLNWSEPKLIGHDIMMNKPTVLSTGEWLFPISVWQRGTFILLPYMDSRREEGAFVYKTSDNGKTFTKLGGAIVPSHLASFSEHMILELKDGRLANYMRTKYGIGVSYSYDRGKTWREGVDSGLGGPDSRFHICRLKSGRILLVNHYKNNGRNNMTALLSEDEGKTFPYHLVLDERSDVSYPDAKEQGGFIHITYDRERGDDKRSFVETYSQAREILYAKITEEDIIAGKIVSKGSKLQVIVSKLGKYYDEMANPYKEVAYYTPESAVKMLTTECKKEEIVSKIFEIYPASGLNLTNEHLEKLDSLISKLQKSENADKALIKEIIMILHIARGEVVDPYFIIERAKKIISENIDAELSIKEISDIVGISYNYMAYLFKKSMGITLTEYRNELRLTMSKRMLLTTDKSITDIAYECGFASASYFTERFTHAEKISPVKYRKLHSQIEQK